MRLNCAFNQPIQMFGTPDGRFVYVANQGTESQPDDTVSVIDTASNKIVGTISVGGAPNRITFRNVEVQ